MYPFRYKQSFENNWYYVTDPLGFQSLQEHGRLITYLIPFWYGVTWEGGLADQSDPRSLDLIRRLNLPVLAIVHNYASPEYRTLIHALLTDDTLRRALVNSILNMLRRTRFAGVNIDFEFVPPEDRPYLTKFMTELYQVLKPERFLTTISVPAQLDDNPRHPFSGAFSYPELGVVSDQVYLLAYDEHFAMPGPIASIGFVQRVLTYALSVIPRIKIRLGIPVYGYDWTEGVNIPETLSYRQAIERAREQGVAPRYDEEAQEWTYTYQVDGETHIVWFEDARSFAAKLALVRRENLRGIGVWRLGLEDSRIWALVGTL
ncbi:glycosyl hydrolase family 18 protein [Desulfofundulus salinus]|uniref:Glycoside hydrolase n=1 Tax=Desulfofundulus salinus TaxID=2419843 RepID=A0A494X1B5_9FIRM|nr:glycosyl hydrolase family 18 protein [Desulfofundulus salinum]RKO66644.1 glycoside hydrolase [Desulfofundulus salinum]